MGHRKSIAERVGRQHASPGYQVRLDEWDHDGAIAKRDDVEETGRQHELEQAHQAVSSPWEKTTTPIPTPSSSSSAGLRCSANAPPNTATASSSSLDG
jgi:hypothetical protein